MSGRRSSQVETTKARGIWHYLGVGLSAGLLAFVLLIGVLVIVVPAATGSTPMTVLTSSMEPTYPPGTLVIVQPIDSQDIRIGDPITYQIESGKEAVVTHRVISITRSTDGSTTFTTQGDNNGAPDAAAVVPDQVKGKVWYSVPWIGYLNNLVNGDNRGWLVPTIAIGLFLYAGYMLASGLATSARKRRVARERAREQRLAKAAAAFGQVSTGSPGHFDRLSTALDEPDPLFRAAPPYKADSL